MKYLFSIFFLLSISASLTARSQKLDHNSEKIHPVIRNRDSIYLKKCFNENTLTTQANIQYYQLDQIDKKPFISNKSMQDIAVAVWEAYDNYTNSHKWYPKLESFTDTVYSFCDTNYDNILERINPVPNERSITLNTKNLLINDRLMFNIKFDSKGNAIIGTNLNIISYHLENDEWVLKETGFSGLELLLDSNSIAKLSNVRLDSLAMKRLSMQSNSLTPVVISLPFSLSRKKINTLEFSGNIGKNLKKIYFKGTVPDSIKRKIEAKINSDSSDFSKASSIAFSSTYSLLEYSIDLRIHRNTFTMESMIDAKKFKANTFLVKYQFPKIKN